MAGIMSVQNNLTAMNANRMLGLTTFAQAKSTEKLSSGYQINRAADDAAGLAISEKMRRQIRGLTQASANCQDGVSLCQVADGALNETQDILQRMNELAIKAANGTLTDTDRSYCQSEVAQLKTEIDRIAYNTTFNEDIYPLLGGKTTVEQTPASTVQGGGQIGAVGNKVSNVGTAGTAAKFISNTVIGGAGNRMNYVSVGGVRWDVNDPPGYVSTSNVSNLVASIVEAYNAGSLNALSGTRNYTFSDVVNGNATLTVPGIVSAYNGMTSEKMNVLVDNFTLDSTGRSDPYMIAKIGGELVSGTALANAVQTAMQVAPPNFTLENLTVSTGTAGTASTVNLDFGTLTGKYLEENNITLTVDDKQYTFTTGTPSTSSQIHVGENDSGAAIASAVNSAVTNVTTSASGSTVIFTENKKFLDANHYFRGYSGQALLVDLSDNPPDISSINSGTLGSVGSNRLFIQAGAEAGQHIDIDLVDARASAIGVAGCDVSTVAGAEASIDSVKSAIKTVSEYRSHFGAIQNRLEHTINNLDNVVENTTSAESRIRDTDMAKEMVKYSMMNILAQAGQSMLAQANQSSQGILSLLS